MRRFSIYKDKLGNDYVVVNNRLNTHAHLGSYGGCMMLINMINKNVSIRNPYLQEAKKRLLTANTKKKYKYYNRTKCQRRI